MNSTADASDDALRGEVYVQGEKKPLNREKIPKDKRLELGAKHGACRIMHTSSSWSSTE